MGNPAPPSDGPRLSVAIICKDSARTIGRTLDSVRGLGAAHGMEIVALDSGSTDGTLELLEAAGAKVHRLDWPGYVAQKNRALDECAGEWVLSLDSDESLTGELRAHVERIVEQPPPVEVTGYEVNRRVWYDGRPLKRAWQPEWRLRLIRRGAARWTGTDPHDKLEPVADGRVETLRGVLRHDSIDTISGFLMKQIEHGRTQGEALAAKGETTSVLKLVTSPVAAWLKQIVLRCAWLDGWRGWLAASSSAVAALAKHADLLERTRAERKDDRP